MASFEEALVALKVGKRVRLDHWNRWLYFNTKRGKLGFDSKDWTWFDWHPSSYEIMSDEWVIEGAYSDTLPLL